MTSLKVRPTWLIYAFVAVASVALGFSGARILANEAHSYVAAFTWFLLMIVGAPLVVCLFCGGCILLLFSDLKKVGRAGILAATLITLSAVLGFQVLNHLGMVRYKHEQMVGVTPPVANVVVFLKENISSDEISVFWEETISIKEDATSHRHLPGISGIWRSDSVNGHEVIILGYFPQATAGERDFVMSRIRSSASVYRIFENVPTASVGSLLRPDTRP